MRPIPLAAVPFLLIAAVAAAWYIPAALIVFAWHYPGIPALAALACVACHEAVNPSPLTRRIKEPS